MPRITGEMIRGAGRSETTPGLEAREIADDVPQSKGGADEDLFNGFLVRQADGIRIDRLPIASHRTLHVGRT